MYNFYKKEIVIKCLLTSVSIIFIPQTILCSTAAQNDVEQEKYAKLTVSTNPDGAEVRVNDHLVGTAPLSAPVVLESGKHILTVHLEGYKSESKRFMAKPGEHVFYEIVLKKIESATQPNNKTPLSIVVNETDATIRVNGLSLGKSPVTNPVQLSPGKHLIQINKQGFKPFEKEVSVSLQEKQVVEAELTQEDKPKGSAVTTVGLIGTVTMTVASGVMWGMSFSKRSDYNENNGKLEELKASAQWDDALEQETRKDFESSNNFNRAAVLTSITTGVFATMFAVGIAVKHNRLNKKQAASTILSPTMSGIRVSF